MAYVFVKKKVVRRKVTIMEPMDGDVFEKREIFVTWEILPNTKAGSYNEAFFEKVISKIEGVADEDTKQEIPSTPEFIKAFLDVSFHLSALQREYMNCTIAAGRGN